MHRIDAHQHFWQYHPVKDAWISDEMRVIKRDFYPDDVHAIMLGHGITGSVAVQADQSEAETSFLMDLAERNPFIKGVVGWVDLQGDDIAGRLQYFHQHKIVKGFRHILQGEADEFMLGDAFLNGIGLLNQYNFTYDILIGHHKLSYAAELVSHFPRQLFVLDHMAKPPIKAKETERWARELTALSKHSNVYCKVSGFGTEADWNNWELADMEPYFDVVFDTFGVDRVMFGSDWPVSLLAGGYSKSLRCLEAYLARLSNADQDKFWGANAVKFYRL